MFLHTHALSQWNSQQQPVPFSFLWPQFNNVSKTLFLKYNSFFFLSSSSDSHYPFGQAVLRLNSPQRKDSGVNNCYVWLLARHIGVFLHSDKVFFPDEGEALTLAPVFHQWCVWHCFCVLPPGHTGMEKGSSEQGRKALHYRIKPCQIK